MVKQRVINSHTMHQKGKLLHQVKPNRAADRDRLLTKSLADVCNALADALGLPADQIDPNRLPDYVKQLAQKGKV